MKLTNDWITGFVDGDGCFSITKIHRKKRGEAPASEDEELRFRFMVRQDQRSADVLYALKKHFGCGTVCRSGGKSGNSMEYSITNRLHLRDKVIAHFVKYPLQTMKRIRFHEFASTLHNYMKGLGEDGGRVLDPCYASADYNLTAGWFRGIVDADGCFSCSLVTGLPLPRFMLGMRRGEIELIEECQRFISCGTLHTRKNGFETLQVTKLADLEEKLVPLFETRGSAVLLRTIKRISFQKWRKIIRLKAEGRHLDPRGLEKIKKYQAGLNDHNESLTAKVVLVV